MVQPVSQFPSVSQVVVVGRGVFSKLADQGIRGSIRRVPTGESGLVPTAGQRPYPVFRRRRATLAQGERGDVEG